MGWSERFQSAFRVALSHLGLSLAVAGAVAWLVFRIWYPSPLHEITGGRNIFLILMAVDVVCGPLLTLVLYDPTKSSFKWRLDLCLIAFVQLSALAYGLHQVSVARPVFVALEGDRFRLVQAFDVDPSKLLEAPEGQRALPYFGPQLIGVRLAVPGDVDYLTSVQLSAQGLHPAFRPSRWRRFEDQSADLQKRLRPVGELRSKNPEREADLDAALRTLGLNDEQIGYLPLVREEITDWVALVRRSDGQPLTYLDLDGW